MYTFAVTVMLGLALLAVVDVLTDLAPALSRRRAAVGLALAVVGAFAVDYSMFEGFGVGLRESWMGTLLTGFVIAGATSVWRAAFLWAGTPRDEEPGAGNPRRPLVRSAA